MPRALRVVLALVLVLVAIPGAAAKDRGKQPFGEKKKLEVELEKGLAIEFEEGSSDPVRGVHYLFGNVRVESKQGGRIQIFADGIVIWGKMTGGVVAADAEIYAEGNVFVQVFRDTFEADWVYLDLSEGEGRLERATVRSTSAVGGGGGTILARAERARVEDGLRTFVGESASVSTCTYHEPHYALTARAVRVDRSEADVLAREEEDARDEVHITVERPGFEVYGYSTFRYPWTLGWNTAWNPFVPSVVAGRSGRFGGFLLSELPVYPGRELEVSAKVDLYERRGVGTGARAEWGGPVGDRQTFLGFVEGIYIRDGAETDTATELPPPRRDRGRIRALHRDDLPFGLRREGEVSWISDRAFLPEFYEREFKTAKEQETALYLRWLGVEAGLPRVGNMGATLFGRWRLNDFQDQVEYLPRGRWSWIGQPVLDDVLPGGRGLYLTTAYEVSNARTRFDEARALPTDRVARADFQNRLDWPFPVGPLQFDPFMTGRYSAWSAEFGSRHDIDRFAGGAGGQVSIDLWRTFGETWRHIATPSIGYSNVFHVDTQSEELIPIDEIENIREQEFVSVAMRNRIQQVRELGGDGPRPATGLVVNVVDWAVRARAFPDRRENAGQRWGSVLSDLRLNPMDNVSSRWRSEWDPNDEGGLFRSDAEVAVRPAPALLITGAHRYFEDSYRAVDGAFDVRLTDKWGFKASSQYDFESRDFTHHRAGVRRYFHRFVLEVLVDADLGEDDVRFAINFAALDDPFGTRNPTVSDDISPTASPLF